MKRLFVILLVISAFSFPTVNAQEVECTLPPQWKCGWRMGLIWAGIGTGTLGFIDCCVASVQVNACNTNGEDALCDEGTFPVDL